MSSDHGEFDVAPTESKTTRTVGNFPRGSRETQAASVSREADRSEKAKGLKSDRHAVGESDSPIVPKKPANNDGVPPSAELVEGRGLTEENAGPSLLGRTQGRKPRSRGLLGVREAAQRDKKMQFNNLLHHLTPELLRASFFDLKKQAAQASTA
jgi:RNA-directed DNA polymerase